MIEGLLLHGVGLQAGDIITSVDGVSLSGLSLEEAVSKVRGPEGSRVTLGIKRNTTTFEITVTRKIIDYKTVNGEMLPGNIAYVDVDSFGDNTPGEFSSVINDLLNKEEIKGWIFDLRDNGGGLVDTAIDLAGYFIGNGTLAQYKERDWAVQLYKGEDHGIRFDQPVIFLTNKRSASASEMLSGAVQDHKAATLIGEKTYGKGSVQTIYGFNKAVVPEGGYLKVTVARFFTPLGRTINEVGITPDLKITETDSLKAAKLLLEGAQPRGNDNTGYIRLKAGPNTFNIELAGIRTEDNWPVYREIISSAASKQLKSGTSKGWKAVAQASQKKLWPLYYPGYVDLKDFLNVPQDQKFTVGYPTAMDWRDVNNGKVELIEADTGVRVPSSFEVINKNKITIAPQDNLKAGTTYWLVVHELTSQSGKKQKGRLAVVTVAGAKEKGITCLKPEPDKVAQEKPEFDGAILRGVRYGDGSPLSH
ncbi:MAG: PDZ domain-containing protein [Firmicutes bacterium]|nr:PDZ domain-containing protein [Bacillota bacterium]